MPFSEHAVVFPVAGESLLGILARPAEPFDCGVLIVVGGPQYRVGSHRQFLLLSRRLAAAGYAAFRFDHRGMGDSGGAMRPFEAISDDIAAAVEAFSGACPGVRRIVLWGLCDAASAALLYVQASGDARLAGLVLLNPWVRSEASLAQTRIKHYYGQRLRQKEFWIKLLGGEMHLRESLKGLLKAALTAALSARARPPAALDESASYQDRMAEGLRLFRGAVLLILSGQDYTAKEFADYAGSNFRWSGLIDARSISRVDLPDADHTFSAQALRRAVEDQTLDWLGRL